MTKTSLTLLAAILLTQTLHAAQIQSPSGAIALEASVIDGVPGYAVKHKGETVIERSPLGLLGKDFDLSRNVKLLGEKTSSIDKPFQMLVGKQLSLRDHCNRVVLALQCGDQAYDIELRAYDDGIAFAYFLKGKSAVTLTGEASGFQFPKSTICWLQQRCMKRGNGVSYEDPWLPVPLGAAATSIKTRKGTATGWSYPAMFKVGDTYALISESGVTENYCATYLGDNCDNGLYRVAFPNQLEGRGTGTNTVTAALPFRSPWRVVMLGALDEVTTSSLVFKVADPLHEKCKGAFPEWIKPGKSVWDWWTVRTGGPDHQRRYIDSAAFLGWDYILVDAKWNRWPDPYAQLRSLVDHGRTQDVGVCIWYNSGGKHTWARMVDPVDLMHERDIRRKEMAKIHEIGIAGIKVDFFGGDKQDRMQQYLGILDDALDYELMINFHGCTIPRGWERRYPNLVTMEAVRGAEAYPKNTKSVKPTAIHNVRLTMTRNVVGSMDFTPVMFNGRCVTDQPESQDYSFTLATAIAFESALAHYPDYADKDKGGYRKVYADYPEVGELLRNIPTTWDETRLLSGDMDSHCLWARRKGSTWYVGGLNGKTDAAQELSVPCSFLGKGSYDMVRIESDGKRAFTISKGTLKGADTLKASLPVGSGISLVLVPRQVAHEPEPGSAEETARGRK